MRAFVIQIPPVMITSPTRMIITSIVSHRGICFEGFLVMVLRLLDGVGILLILPLYQNIRKVEGTCFVGHTEEVDAGRLQQRPLVLHIGHSA